MTPTPPEPEPRPNAEQNNVAGTQNNVERDQYNAAGDQVIGTQGDVHQKRVSVSVNHTPSAVRQGCINITITNVFIATLTILFIGGSFLYAQKWGGGEGVNDAGMPTTVAEQLTPTIVTEQATAEEARANAEATRVAAQATIEDNCPSDGYSGLCALATELLTPQPIPTTPPVILTAEAAYENAQATLIAVATFGLPTFTPIPPHP